MNSFGKKIILTTFGESHGVAIGGVLDGVPAGLRIDFDFIQQELNRRKPGRNEYATQRKEDDKIEFLSGIFEGVTTGTPIGFIIKNTNQKSKDYSNIKDLFRPGHADFTYFYKYGLRDYRGGGRSSARETAIRVAAGAIAKLMLKELGIEVVGGVFSIGNIEVKKIDFENVKKSEIYSLDSSIEDEQKKLIQEVREAHDSIGGSVFIKVKNAPIGLGEPLYYKLDAALSSAMMGINGVKSVGIGKGAVASKLKGSVNNDQIDKNGFLSNNSGGILGGISNGEEINIKVHFKPTPSIFQPLKTVDTNGKEQILELKGRHDPCIAIRGYVVAEAMAALVVADMVVLNMSSKMQYLKKIYDII